MKRLILSLIVASVALTGLARAQGSDEDRLKNEDIALWPQERKVTYISGQILMLGHVVGLIDPDQGECIWDWYFEDAANKNAQIIREFNRYPEELPSTIILALAERACGKLPSA